MTSAPDIASVVLRALAYILLFQATGVALFVASFGPRLSGSLRSVRLLGATAAVAAIVLLSGHYALEAARMAGEFSGSLDASLQALVVRSSTGGAFALRVTGLALVAFALQTPSSWRRVGGVVGTLLAAIAFTLNGHTSVHADRPILAAMLMAHILIGMFWFGALLPLRLVSVRETPDTAATIIETFSAVSVWLVPVILVAGVVMAALLVPGLATFGQPYGALLITKVVLFAVLMVLAAANKWRFGPGIARSAPAAVSGFRKSVVAEFVVICVVLVVTVGLTTFYSP